WMGGQAEQVELRGGLVQVTLRCDASAEAEHCVAFRVYGVNGDEDDDSASGMLASSKKGDRLELIVAILCAVLLFLTVLGSVIMWNLCWRYHKDRLSRKIHMQVMYQQRVQQGIYQTNQPPFPYPPAPGQHPFSPMGDCMVPSQLEIHRQMEAEANASRAQWSGSIDFPDAQGPASPSAAANTVALLSNAEQQQLRIQPPPPYPQNAKRKLFFSPEFFEPELMQDPPQLAEEFLYEVRRMIDMAKNRIRLRRHMPNLFAIPEEGG
uniref:Uncharacterized protein n=1 Tax=Plectus sambesii TaxID=2011161 RepID=A0A914V583_9BILA